jgi:hypothetical protein
MRPAVCLLCLALSLACAQAAHAPLPKPDAKQPTLTAERLLSAEEQFFNIKSIERRGRATWEVVGMRGIPWCDEAWKLRTFLVSEVVGGQGQRLKVAEVAVHDARR